MSATLEKLETEALKLSNTERAFLADRLISSLDTVPMSDVDEAWVLEASRRYDLFKSGKREPIPAQEVFAESGSRP